MFVFQGWMKLLQFIYVAGEATPPDVGCGRTSLALHSGSTYSRTWWKSHMALNHHHLHAVALHHAELSSRSSSQTSVLQTAKKKYRALIHVIHRVELGIGRSSLGAEVSVSCLFYLSYSLDMKLKCQKCKQTI